MQAQNNGEVRVSLYPVPLRANVLNVKMISEVAMKAQTIELRNFIGKKLQTKPTKGSKEIDFQDMSAYPEGVYVILIKDGAGKIIETAKFMISN